MAQKVNTIIVTNVASEGPRLIIWGVMDHKKQLIVEYSIGVLSNKFSQRYGFPSPQNQISPEAVCCVNYRGKYLRAKISEIRPTGVLISLIDIGKTDFVPLDVIRLLSRNSQEEEALLNIPPLAFEMILANTVSITEKWESRSVDCILGFIKDKEIEVSYYDTYNSRYMVSLVYNGQDIGNVLVNKRMAKMATVEEMFKSTMYSQQPPYKVPPVTHQQQMPISQMSTNGFSGGERAFNTSHINQMTTHQPSGESNWRFNQTSFLNQPSSFLYQQPSIQHANPIARATVNRKSESDDESDPTVLGFRSCLPQIGKSYPAKITFVEDGPSKFSVQLLENRDDLMNLMKGIQAHEATPFTVPPLIGAMCLARLKTRESTLSRAVVMATLETQVKIYFVDFGHTECVSHTDIYKLPKKFIKDKVLSIRICLTGLKEMNVTEEVKKYFTDFVSGKEVDVLFREPEGPFLIQYGDLFYNGKNIKEYLKERFPDIASVTYGHIPSMTDGTKETVYVSYVSSCSKFFVQLEKNTKDLEDMMAVILDYASSAPPMKQISVNTLCIAPYDVDEQWYRVKILKINGDKVNILYVDYGNEETVNKSQLRTIRKDLVTQMPCQAIQCVLNGFQSRTSNAQFNSHFESLTFDKRLSMTVKNAQPSCLIVDLYDITTTPPTNILQELNKSAMEAKTVNTETGFSKKSNDFEPSSNKNHQRDDAGGFNGTSNQFQSNNDDASNSRSKTWKDDHNEQKVDNRYQRREDGDRFNRDSASDRNGRSNNFNRDGANRSFNRDGGNDRFNRDGGNDRFNRSGGSDRLNRDEGNNSFKEAENNPFGRDGGSNPFNQDKGNDRFNRDGNSKFSRDGGNDRFNRDGGNSRFNRDGGNDRFNRDGGNDRFNRDGGNKFNRDGDSDRFNRSGGSDRFNKDEARNDRNSFRDGGRNNQYYQHDNRDDRNRGNRFGSNKRDTNFGSSDNESVASSKGSGKRGDRGFQSKQDSFSRSNNFNKFENKDSENDGFRTRRNEDNSGNNFKSKTGRDDGFNKSKDVNNFDSGIDFSEPKVLEIPLPPITLGNKNRCELVYLTDLSNFYVQLIPENEKLEQLMDKIAATYEFGGTILESSKVKPNVPCITQYAEDERWYRVLVKSVEGDTANVLFVDYGNVETVNINMLKEISEEFTKLPIQAVPCKLFGTKKTEWSDEEVTSFGDMTNEKIFEAEFVTKENDWIQVLLREVENEVTKSETVNATFCPGVDLVKEKEALRSSTTVSNVGRRQNSLDFAMSGSRWIDEEIKSGTKDTVMVTWFNDPGSFYCQSINKQKEFRPMMEEIQKVYVARESVSDTLQPGYPVIAIFAQDEALYRAEIVEVKSNKNHVVQYVDFGNTATVNEREMYPVEKRFMTLSKQAIRCSLKNIVPVNGGNWTSQNSQEIEKCLFDIDEFQCTFYEKKDNTYEISLSNNGVDVANSLIEKNHALSATACTTQISAEKETDKATVKTTEKTTEKTAEKTTEKTSTDEALRFDIQLLPGQTLRVKVSSVESVSKFHVQFSSADTCNQAISSYMTNNDPKVLALPSQLSVMQNQAIECALHNVEPSSTLNKKLKDMVLNKEVMIYVENIDTNRLIVELYDSLGCKIQMNDDADSKISPVCPMPILSSTHKVNVSAANHSNSLWLQMVSDAQKDSKLNQEMTEFYSKNKEKAEPEINRLCVIESDGVFSRAKIIKKNNDTVTVNLIDYGNNTDVSFDKLLVLDYRFHLPHQLAIHVSLNVTLQGAPFEQIKALKPHLLNKEFTAVFYNVHKKWIVELIENGVKLSETLTGLKLVKEATPTITEETEEVFEGEKIKVIVSHADSPAQLWLQRVDEISRLEEIQKELQTAVSSYPAVDKVLDASLCAVFSHGTWYRAEVIDADEDIVTARFIDYGKTDIINNKPENIKALPDSMKSKKACGIKCRLDVVPVGSEDWSDPICIWIQDLMNQKNIQAVFISDNLPKRVDLFIDGKSVIDTLVEEGKALKLHHEEELVEEIVEVELDPRSAFISHIYSPSDFYLQEEKSISDLETIQDRFVIANLFPLISDVKEGLLCVAKYSDDSYYRARVISKNESGAKVLFIDYGNFAEVTEMREIPEDVACIPPLARKCSLQLPYYASRWPNNAVDIFCELSAEGATIFLMDVLKEGETTIVKLTLDNQDIVEKLSTPETVFICNINSPQEFWVLKDNLASEVDSIQEKLCEAENYSPVEAKEGLSVAAKFPEDELWYRAQILSHNENETFVVFIDYGNSSSCSEIRALPEDLASIAPFAKKCCLQLPADAQEWSADAFDIFCTLAGDGAVSFIQDIVEEKETTIVNLFLNGENIAKKLVAQGSGKQPEEEQKDAEKVDETVSLEKVPEVAVSEVAVQEVVPEVAVQEVVPEVAVAEKATIVEKDVAQGSSEKAPAVSVFISQLTSVQEFWVQQENLADKLEEVGNMLLEFENTAAVENPKEGFIYAALYPFDSFWYRAKILSCKENDVNVFFIDYGNSDSVKEIRYLSDDLKNMAPLAKKCSLKLPSDVAEWTEEALAEFNKLSADGTTSFMMEVLNEGDTAIVDLKLNGESIVDKLVESGRKETHSSETEQEKMSSGKTDPRDDSAKTAPIDEDSSKVETSAISDDSTKAETPTIHDDSAKAETPAIDDDSAKAETAKLVDAEKVNKIIEKTAHPDEIHASKEEHFSSEIDKRLPPEGEEVLNMTISHVISPSMFWGQTESDIPKLEKMEMRLGDVEDFEQLNNFEFGKLCAAQFPDDGIWYRGKLLSGDVHSAEVFYVDYGNTATVSNLKELPPDLIAAEHLSQQYTLRKPSQIKDWSNEACEKFLEFVNLGATMFQYKILDSERKELQLMYKGTDVVELLIPLCATVTKLDEKLDKKTEQSVEVIDLTEDLDDSVTEIKTNEGEQSPDSAFHSEKVADSSFSSHEPETAIVSDQRELPAVVKEPDNLVSKNIQGELSVDDIMEKMIYVPEEKTSTSQTPSEPESSSKVEGEKIISESEDDLSVKSKSGDEKSHTDSVSGEQVTNAQEEIDTVKPKIIRRRSSAHEDLVLPGFLAGSQPTTDGSTVEDETSAKCRMERRLSHDDKLLPASVSGIDNLSTGNKSQSQ